VYAGYLDGTILQLKRSTDRTDSLVLDVVRQLKEHKRAITSLNLYQDLLFSMSADRTVRVWSSNDSKSIGKVKENDEIKCILVVENEQLFIGKEKIIAAYSIRVSNSLLSSHFFL
jgi:WD40 repeat protein